MKYEIDPRGDYFVITTSGSADTAVYEEALDAVLNHPDWRAGCAYIFDHSALDASSLQRNDVDRIVEISRTRRARHGVRKSAIVARSDVAFGIGRMILAYAEELDIPKDKIPAHIFRTLAEAEAWVREK